jgi:hypothetical protein
MSPVPLRVSSRRVGVMPVKPSPLVAPVSNQPTMSAAALPVPVEVLQADLAARPRRARTRLGTMSPATVQVGAVGVVGQERRLVVEHPDRIGRVDDARGSFG